MTGFKYYANKVLGEIKSSFANNMFILLFLILVFIIPLIAAYYYPDSFASVLQPMIQQFEQNIADGTVTLATDSLFVNNFTVALILYAGGALLGIMGITVLAMNGLFLGFFAAQMDLTSYIALTLPHGIFEIPAIIIACAGGLVLLKFAVLFVWNIIRPDTHDETYNHYFGELGLSFKDKFMLSLNKHQDKIKESFILLVVSAVLLIIAAFIEANLTIPIARFFLSFLGIQI